MPSIQMVIFITARFRVLPEHADHWAELTRPFTEATRGTNHIERSLRYSE
jgi:hypothetical protein